MANALYTLKLAEHHLNDNQMTMFYAVGAGVCQTLMETQDQLSTVSAAGWTSFGKAQLPTEDVYQVCSHQIECYM